MAGPTGPRAPLGTSTFPRGSRRLTSSPLANGTRAPSGPNRADDHPQVVLPSFRGKTRTEPGIAYSVFGDGGPPILFMMGLGMPGIVWRSQVEDLARDHWCCHYDHLGLGRSDDGSLFRTIPSMADDALRVMDELSWERAHIVGVSMGGMIAQELVLRVPERCATVTLIATHAGGPGAVIPTLRGSMVFAQVLFLGHRARLRSMPRLIYPEEYLRQQDPIELRMRMEERLPEPLRIRTIFGQLTAVLRHRAESRLGEIRRPTLLVRPGRDVLIRPVQIDRLSQRIPHAEVVRFDDAGHGVIHQKAAQLNEVLRRHFAKAAY